METEQPLEVTARFQPFVSTVTEVDYIAKFHQVPELPEYPEQVLFEGVDYRLHHDGNGGFLRTFFDAPRDLDAYAVASYDWSNHSIDISYLPKGAGNVSRIDNCFYHLAWETLLLHEQKLILHASCIDTEFGGILFSGESGIGKSTQAHLWGVHRGSRMINGDRPILSKTNSGWLAYGSPYAGSSHCFVNESVSVGAVVMLRQGTICDVRRLSAAEAFRSVYKGVTLNNCDVDCVNTACDLIMTLIHEVPVFEFTCTPDEAAVNVLESVLREVTGDGYAE